MIRLVSQFDNEKMRASVATPTCGGCCSCCCCCVVTTLASSIITARNLGRLADMQAQNISSPNQTKKSKLQARLMGFFLLPISIGVGFLIPLIYCGENLIFSAASIASIAVIFALGLYMFKNKFGLSGKTATYIFILTVAGLVAEFFAWLYLLFLFS